MSRDSSEGTPDYDDNHDFIYTFNPTPEKPRFQDSTLSKNQLYAEDNILEYHDIVTDEETLEFLNKHFSKIPMELLDIESFLDALLQEFFLRNPSVANSVEDIAEFRGELRDLLRQSLTTNNDEIVSLNALEVNTKKKGLYDFVMDLASEAKNVTKAKKTTQINEAVMEELSVLTHMLNSKRDELIEREQRLREYEENLNERENRMKRLLQEEYERLCKSFDESCKEKFGNLQKKFTTHEKSVRIKIKQYDSQLKEMKSQTASLSGVEDKLKFKVSSLEKTNEFLKLKAQELEKKITQEQELKQSTSQKNQKLLSKISLLERSVKELQTGQFSISQSLPRQMENEHVNYSKLDEKPLEVIDLNSSRTKDWNDKEESEQIERSPSPEVRKKEDSSTLKSQKNPKANVLKKTKGAATETLPGPKKEVTVPMKTNSSSNEIKVLLNVIHSLLTCLKSTLPVFLHSIPAKVDKDHEDMKEGERKSMREETEKDESMNGEKGCVDLGEVFYPCFDTLVSNLTELLPLLGKSYDIRYVSSIVEVYFQLLDFSFRFKIQKKFEQQQTLEAKLGLDDNFRTTSFDLSFVPQTEYWKNIIKTTKPLQKAKTGNDLQSSILHSLNKESKVQANKQTNYINLFSEDLVQKEVLTILKKFLDSTDLTGKSDKDMNLNASVSSNIVQANTKETQSSLLMTRLYASLITILLAKTRKEQLIGLQSLITDLNIDNIKIAESLRTLLIEKDGLNILFWLLKTFLYDFDLIQLTTDILLSLNYNGAHYRSFIETLSKEENIETVFEILAHYGKNNEFCEKMSVIVQRITYHNDLKGKIPDKYLKFLKDKLNELEILKNNQFFIANIKSILLNLNVM